MRTLCLAGLLIGCGGASPEPAQPLPGERFAIEWSVSQELWGSEVLTVDPAGQARYRFESARGEPSIDGSRRLSGAELASIRRATADATFCQLHTGRDGIPDEGQPSLRVTRGARSCTVSLWDGEWEELPTARPVLQTIKDLIALMKAGS